MAPLANGRGGRNTWDSGVNVLKKEVSQMSEMSHWPFQKRTHSITNMKKPDSYNFEYFMNYYIVSLYHVLE